MIEAPTHETLTYRNVLDDTWDDPGMIHWLNEDETRTLCGIDRTPADPILYDDGPSECVVCHDLWLQL